MTVSESEKYQDVTKIPMKLLLYDFGEVDKKNCGIPIQSWLIQVDKKCLRKKKSCSVSSVEDTVNILPDFFLSPGISLKVKEVYNRYNNYAWNLAVLFRATFIKTTLLYSNTYVLKY